MATSAVLVGEANCLDLDYLAGCLYETNRIDNQVVTRLCENSAILMQHIQDNVYLYFIETHKPKNYTMKTQTQNTESNYFINCIIESESENAIKVCNSKAPYGTWFPKSQVRVEKIEGNDEQVKLFAPEWLFNSKKISCLLETSCGLFEKETNA